MNRRLISFLIAVLIALLVAIASSAQSVKISDMPAATDPTGAELVPIVQSGSNRKATIGQFRGFNTFGTNGQLIRVNATSNGFDFFTHDFVQTSGSFANPSWITSLGWNKITSTPTTLLGYGITGAETLPSLRLNGTAGAGFLQMDWQSSSPVGASSRTTLWADAIGRLNWRMGTGGGSTIISSDYNNTVSYFQLSYDDQTISSGNILFGDFNGLTITSHEGPGFTGIPSELLFYNGQLNYIDNQSSKTGILYGAAGYVTTDRSLTDRGFVLGAKTFTGRQTFATGNNGSLVVGTHTADDSSPVNGLIMYNTTSNTFRFRQNGTWVGLGSGLTDGDYGDVTVSGTGTAINVDNGAITYAKIQNVAANSFLANVTGSSATVQAVATNRIPLFSSAITGTPSSTTFLRGDGAWITPSGSGDVVGPSSSLNNRIAQFSGTTGKLIKEASGLGFEFTDLVFYTTISPSIYPTGANPALDLTIRGGNNIATNGNGGHLYLTHGNKTGTGIDGNIGILTGNVGNWQSMQRGLFIANAAANPAGNPSDGGFLYSDGSDGSKLKWRVPSGTVFDLTATGGGSLSNGGNATNADFTAAVNTVYYLPSATLTTNRTITIPTGANMDLIEFYNNETGFTWNLAGELVYLSDNVTTVTSLLANTNYIIRRVNGRWRVAN